MRRLNSPHDETPRRSDWVARMKGSTIAGIVLATLSVVVGYVYLFGTVLGAFIMTTNSLTLPPPVDPRATTRKSSESAFPLRREDGTPLWQKKEKK